MSPNRCCTSRRARGLILASAVALALGASHGGPAAQAAGDQQDPRSLTVIEIPESDLKVSAWLNGSRSSYVIGETVHLNVRANEDAYVTVFNTDAQGQTTVVFPNGFQQDNKVSANSVVSIPGPNDDFRLQVGGPAGSNLIKVIASKKPISLIDAAGFVSRGAFRSFDGQPGGLANHLRTVIVASPDAGWAAADLPFTVVSQPEAAPSIIISTVESPALPALAGLLSEENGGFGLQMALGKQAYAIGEPLTLTVVAEKDCKLTLISVDGAGAATVLFPNAAQQETELTAGRVRFLPGAGSKVQYLIAGSSGEQAIVGLCVEEQPDLFTVLFGRSRAAVPVLSDSELNQVLAELDKLPADQVAKAVAVFTVAGQ